MYIIFKKLNDPETVISLESAEIGHYVFYKTAKAEALILGMFEDFKEYSDFQATLPMGEYSSINSYGKETRFIVKNVVQVEELR